MTDFTKLYVVMILKDIIKNIKRLNKLIEKNNISKVEYGLCDGSSRYWKLQQAHDVLCGELNEYYKRLNELDKQTNWYEFKDLQDRFKFLIKEKEILDRYKMLYKEI